MMDEVSDTDAAATPRPAEGEGALAGVRICDFTGQLAGAGATKWLASFGAEVIRIEDPVREGRWDILRGNEPFKDDRRGINLGGAFNNHNAGKKGITLNLRTKQGRLLLEELISHCDAVTENFAAGVLERWGFGYERLKELKPDIVYVSNCGFGHEGPYSRFKTWGPIVQAVSGLTYTSGLKGQAPAGWGYSYMDHTGGYYMAMALLLALLHRSHTGEGQWVDLSCSDAALTLHGPALLDWSANGRGLWSPEGVDSNGSGWLQHAPHGIFPCADVADSSDHWIALACRDDQEWQSLGQLIDEAWVRAPRFNEVEGRLASEGELSHLLGQWTAKRDAAELEITLNTRGIPAARVMQPQQRIDADPSMSDFGLWPEVQHSEMGAVRVDGQPVKFSATPWQLSNGAPCLSEHTHDVLQGLLGYSKSEVEAFYAEGII